jgi:hypothetical protein
MIQASSTWMTDPKRISDRRQMSVLSAKLCRQGTCRAVPKITHQRCNFLGDQAVAFDGEFHRFG